MQVQKIGFMQGRLSAVVGNRIQAFPWQTWEEEFALAQQNDFNLMEWTLDHENLSANPFVTASGQSRIKQLRQAFGVAVKSVTGDCFMQAPFFKAVGEKRAALLAELKLIITSCAKLGVRYIVYPLVDAGAVENTQQEEILIEYLVAFTPLLIERQVKILFEMECVPQHVSSFISFFDNKAFGINYDMGNSAALNYDVDEELSRYGYYIENVHIKDRKRGGTTVPLGTGNADFQRIFRAFEILNYKGNYILQTARALPGKDVEALVGYRHFVSKIMNTVISHEA